MPSEPQYPPVPPPPAGARPSLAHNSMRPIAVDSTGVSMSWRVFWAAFVFLVASGTLWTTLGLAKLDDLDDHNRSQLAHPVVLEEGTKAVPMAEAMRTRYKLAKEHRQEYEKLKAGYAIVATVKVDLDTDRAERLADRAADKVRNPQRSREIWKTVRATALQNLRADPPRPIRAGLERYLD